MSLTRHPIRNPRYQFKHCKEKVLSNGKGCEQLTIQYKKPISTQKGLAHKGIKIYKLFHKPDPRFLSAICTFLFQMYMMPLSTIAVNPKKALQSAIQLCRLFFNLGCHHFFFGFSFCSTGEDFAPRGICGFGGVSVTWRMYLVSCIRE